MAAVSFFGGGQSNGSAVLYQQVAEHANAGALTDVSALMANGTSTRKMDRPKNLERSKRKFFDSVTARDGTVMAGTPMSYVASDNYPTYANAAAMLGQATGQDYSAYVTKFAETYGMGKVQVGKAKAVGGGFIEVDPSWQALSNPVATASLTPKTPKSPKAGSAAAAPSAAPVFGFNFGR